MLLRLFKKNRQLYLIAALSMALFALIQLYDPPLVRDHIEAKTYDLRLQLRNLVRAVPPTGDVVTVVIDEKSIAEIGRWPWSREVQARLIDAIAAAKPKVIGIDIMFSQSESPKADAALADALARAGNVVLATPFLLPEPGEAVQKPEAAPDFLWDSAFMKVQSVAGIDWKRWAVRPVQVSAPVPVIARAALLGSATTLPDLDGVVRWEILSVNYGDDCYPSLALQVARIAAQVPMKEMVCYGGSSIRLGSHAVSTDLAGRVLINYRGGRNSFPFISAVDLIKNRVAPERIHGRIILVGTSALATYDQKVTPFSGDLPGVEKNANVVSNLLANDFIRKSPGVAELVCILMTSLVLVIFMPRLRPSGGTLLAFCLIGGYLFAACYLLIYRNLWLNVVTPTLNMGVIYSAATFIRLFLEERHSRKIRSMFSSYVTERLVDEMIQNPELARLGGEMREITLLFSDVQDFTAYSEQHRPEEVVAILNEYLGAMTDIILRWEGILDKFIGDAIVAFWGAPMAQPDHAERAVHCALEMQERLEELREKWLNEGRAPLYAGIGLNTGEAIVGNIGAEGKKMDYTIIGDQVNLGARIEGLTRYYDAQVLLSEYTVEKLRPAVAAGALRGMSFCGLERVIVKGKDTPVGIYVIALIDPDMQAVVVDCDQDQVVRFTEK